MDYPGQLEQQPDDPNADVRITTAPSARSGLLDRYRAQLAEAEAAVAELEAIAQPTRAEQTELTAARGRAATLGGLVRRLEVTLAAEDDRPEPRPRPTAPTRPTTRTIGGKLFQWDPASQDWREVLSPAPRATAAATRASGGSSTGGSSAPGATPFQAAQMERWERQAAFEDEKARRELQGATVGLVSNHQQLIDHLQGEIAAGRITAAEASNYVNLSRQNAESALRGTTVAAEDAARRAEERARQAAGEAILSRRLQTGTSMAQALLGAAMGVRMPKGQSSLGFDPAAAAWLLTEQMGGGPEVSALGREMLLGARGGPPQETLELPPLPPIGSGAPIGGGSPWPGVPAPAQGAPGPGPGPSQDAAPPPPAVPAPPRPPSPAELLERGHPSGVYVR